MDELYSAPVGSPPGPEAGLIKELQALSDVARSERLTQPIIDLFGKLLKARRELGLTPAQFGLSREILSDLAVKHADIDEHGVTMGGRFEPGYSHRRGSQPSGERLHDQKG